MDVLGNRGKCAQPCRLPYTLIDQNQKILDKGYLISPRDLCTLEYLPNLIKAGVTSFKIEGRMKSPTYVATVTRIYRKYIDLATKYIKHEISEYTIDTNDKNDLLQVFNRGGFSDGHLSSNPNKGLIFKEKPNNMGIYLGEILKYNKNKGLVTVKLENKVSVGDSISFENEDSKYTISELMDKNTNIKSGNISQIVTFGRMKGNIKIGDKIYKIADKELSAEALNSYSKESVKTLLYCKLNISSCQKINVSVKSIDFDLEDNFVYDYIPDVAKSAPITIDNIKKQFNKTLNTCFEFSNIDIVLDDNLFIPTSILNDIRRETISHIENKIIKSFKRTSKTVQHYNLSETPEPQKHLASESSKPQKAILLNILNTNLDYTKLQNPDKIYIPLKYFANKNFENIIGTLAKKAKLYIYMPVIVKDIFAHSIANIITKSFEKFNIFGIVVSNLSELKIIENCKIPKDIELIANYTFNVYNSYTIQELNRLNLKTVTISPELDNESLSEICSTNKNIEIITQGKIPLMTMSYCLLGRSNKCYKNCKKYCLSQNEFYLKDRYNFNFRVVPDNLQSITTIYNSRSLQVDTSELNAYSLRYDLLC